MLKRIVVMVTAATILGLAAPANAQMYGGGWWGGPYHSYYSYHRHYYDYYPRHHFYAVPRHHFYGYGYRSWWGGY